MTRRNSSLGFLGRFGRSEDLRLLDAALRGFDLHPALVPEGAKLAIVNMMKDAWPDAAPPADAYPPLAHLFAYCLLGPDLFAEANGPDAAAEAEARIEAALDTGAGAGAGADEGMDADLILLALHAKLANPKVVEKFGLSAEEE